MELALLGATGPSGRVLINAALERGHNLSEYTRTPSKPDQTRILRISRGVGKFKRDFWVRMGWDWVLFDERIWLRLWLMKLRIGSG